MYKKKTTHQFVVIVVVFFFLSFRERCHESEKTPGVPAAPQSLEFAVEESAE